MNAWASCRARSIVDHSALLADIEASSRNTRIARSRFQGLANFSRPVCSATASGADGARA